jgi:hypothetical protein
MSSKLFEFKDINVEEFSDKLIMNESKEDFNDAPGAQPTDYIQNIAEVIRENQI